MIRLILATLLLPLVIASAVMADQEGANRPAVYSSQQGNVFARAVPADSYGLKGITRVYRAGAAAEQDELLHTFDWYAGKVYLESVPEGLSIVRTGAWARGHLATKDELAIAFYLGEKLLKEYSTLDIAGAPRNVRASASHYRVIEKIHGYRWTPGGKYVFDIQTTDGRTLSFSTTTGEPVPPAATTAPSR
ncbi:MAG TPA: hypothetical protein VER17_14745 [Tepidisphaeraceae bacterium]|nr:hypothetical protein [Tepidisphaeraceae bacterium]